MVDSSYDREKAARERKTELREELEEIEAQRLEHASFQDQFKDNKEEPQPAPDEEEPEQAVEQDRVGRLSQARNIAQQKIAEQVKKRIKKAVKARAEQAIATEVAASTAPIWGTALVIIGAIIGVIALIIMVIMAICNDSWLTRTTAVWSGILPEEVCVAFDLESGGGQVSTFSGGSLGGGGASRSCAPEQDQQNALANNVPYPARNAPELDTLITCITDEIEEAGFTASDLGSVFTFENRNPACNYTRGQANICGACIHTLNSCHYGGQNGSSGAQAVDFGNEAIASEIITAANACGAGFVLNEGTHVHVSTASCDVDGSGDF